MIYEFLLVFFTVPPQKPTIFDGQARELGGIAGPYNEGSQMTLTCIASGGKLITFVTTRIISSRD